MKLLAIFVAVICSGIAYGSFPAEKLPILISPQPPRPVCDIMCTMDYRPVCCLPISLCGDCLSFSNACGLDVYNCENPGNIYYQYADASCDAIGKSNEFEFPIEELA